LVVIVYAILTELPVVYFFYDSAVWSAGFLLLIFSISVWNGGGFYIEVFGRKCVLHPILLTHFVLYCYSKLFFLEGSNAN